jgi:phosphonate transport system substrate-binding protein
MNPDAPNPAPAAPLKKRLLSAPTLVLAAILVAAGVGYYLYVRSENATPPVDEFNSLKGYFSRLGQNQKLAPEFADADGDLIADPPADASKLPPVKEIGFCAVGTDDEERLKKEQADYKDLMAALSKATGLPVKYRTDVGGIAAQMSGLKDGALQVTAFNTGAVAEAVNVAGFTPMFVPADASGKFGIRAEILVKASSPIQKPEDLHGKTVGFVALSSNSGAKLPMFVLKEKFGMLPARDYKHRIIGDHTKAVVALATTNDYDAVCVASDLKDAAFANPALKLSADQFRVVYASESLPPLCFGVPHTLPPELKSKIETVFKEFRFADAKPSRVKFAPANYKEDWKSVREIDAALSRLADLP